MELTTMLRRRHTHPQPRPSSGRGMGSRPEAITLPRPQGLHLGLCAVPLWVSPASPVLGGTEHCPEGPTSRLKCPDAWTLPRAFSRL